MILMRNTGKILLLRFCFNHTWARKRGEGALSEEILDDQKKVAK
jgi:hypothetical protein